MKFIALYKAPVSVLENWMQTDPEVRREAEKKMQSEWNAWMQKNAAQVIETAGAGKTKLVTKDGIKDTKNDVMMYSLVEAESHDAAAKMFGGHPHLGIPEGTIEIMQANVLPGMKA